MEYERLTKKGLENGEIHFVLDKNNKVIVDRKLFEEAIKIHKRLAELEDKIEQGTLIEFNMKLPFKIGDTAYWLNGVPNCIQEYKVLGYIFDYSAGIRIDLGDFQPILCRVFGEYLFSSYAEAEKRLKELQE